MFVMMPQVHCVEGSRVRNIKKHFEVLSNECTSEADIKMTCSSSSPNDGKVSERQAYKKMVPSEPEESINCKSNVNCKESVVKNDKCNIKRSPAFRCDRIVKGKNVTGQIRDKHTSVEDKVKLFEDGRIKTCEPISGIPLVVPEHSNIKGSRESKVSPNAVNPIHSPDISSKILNRKILGGNSKKDYNPLSHTNVSAHLNVFERNVPVSFSPLSSNPCRSDNMVCERSMLLIGVCEVLKEDTKVSVKGVSSTKDNLTDILKSPLPRGPPPRKPPRTFAHSCSQSVGHCNRVPKTAVSIKQCTKETLKGSVGATIITPTLVRSKTESQIELRNKLETALSKLPSGGDHPRFGGRSSMIETNQPNLTHPCRQLPSSKPDVSPSSLLVGCLSLGCVGSHEYEEVGAGRQCQFFIGSSDRREILDIRSSLIDATQEKNSSLSLVRSQSEDHIYAVPFGDVKSKETCILKQDSLPQNNSILLKNRSDETLKGCKDLECPESNGLHYMCTPILSHGKLHSSNAHGEYTHKIAVPHQNLLGFGAVRQYCPSHLRSAGLIKQAENSSKMDNNLVQSVMNKNFDTAQAMLSGPNLQEDVRESGLAQGIGKDSFNKGSKTSLCSPSTETEDENGEDEHEAMTEEMVEQRKGYVRRVCSMFQKLQIESNTHSQGLATADFLGKNSQHSKTSPISLPTHNVPSSPHPLPSQIPYTSFQHLFECILLVGLTLNSNQDEGKIYEPYIQSKFPSDVLVPPWIEHLCFPDAMDWPISNTASSAKGCIGDDLKKKDAKVGDGVVGAACRGRTYSLVITGPDGSRRFGYCRRVLPEGGSLCLPLNYCLISPYRANGFYFKVLAELESRHGQPETERTAFLQELYSCPLPGPGQIPCPLPSTPSPSPFLASLRRPVDTRLEERDAMELFCCLEVGVFLDVFASLLLERKVLLTSKSLSKLSSCIEALQSVLYPFSWQHTFIPVLPAPMLDICHAPTPYIIGVLKGCNGQVPSITLDEGIMVDLDTSHYLQRVGDEGSILPTRIKRALEAALRLVSWLTPPPQPYLSKHNSNPDGATPVRNVLVSEAFLRMFLMVVGHYPNHIVVQQDGRRVFQRESFIKAMPFSGIQMFLEWFTETAMFSAFINSRLEGGFESGDGIFEQRAHKFCEELEKDSFLFLKHYKAITKKNKSFGDRLKDWAPFA